MEMEYVLSFVMQIAITKMLNIFLMRFRVRKNVNSAFIHAAFVIVPSASHSIKNWQLESL